MKRLILIEKTIPFTRVAVLTDYELTATYIDSNLNPDLQNKIIVGQVDKIVKNLNAAFVDYGEEKKGLLHLSQVPKAYQNKIHQGSRVPIQVVKQNEGEKGNKLTGKISLKGKYLVCLPFESGINVSKKIKSQSVRHLLKEVLSEFESHGYGFIVRTHAEHIDINAIREDAELLIKKTDHLMQIKDNLSKGTTLYEELPMYIQIVIETINYSEEAEVVCDDVDVARHLESVFQDYMNEEKIIKITMLDNEQDIFKIYDIQKEINNLQHRKIWLKNGGNIIIDYMEALTVIDVNSAKAILSSNHRKAVKELNHLAIKEAILQILRRNLSGIIIIDLIEMPSDEDKEEAYYYAKKIITESGDKRTRVFPITEVGLMQLSRSKKYTSIPAKIFTPCKICNSSTGDLSNEYQVYLIEKKIKFAAYHTSNQEVTIKSCEELFQYFKTYHLTQLLENKYGIKIHLTKMEKPQQENFLCVYYEE